ncbi:GFA family protein [Thiolapillus sp.]
MYTGSCLCGEVRFEIHGKIDSIVYCHCSLCRKAQGSAFATNGVVQREDFHFLQGENELSAFESSPGQHKLFCRHCGSPVISINTATPDKVRIRLDTIETPISERPEAHIFASSRANWDKIHDDLPQYDGYEPNRQKKRQ